MGLLKVVQCCYPYYFFTFVRNSQNLSSSSMLHFPWSRESFRRFLEVIFVSSLIEHDSTKRCMAKLMPWQMKCSTVERTPAPKAIN